MSDTFTLAQLRTYHQDITHTANDSNYAGTTIELQWLNKAYQKSAYKYSWPQTLKRFADVVVANVDRYSLQSDFRKFMFMIAQGMTLEPTTPDHVIGTFGEYAVVLDSLEYILAQLPTTASTAFTFSGSYSAGSTVIVTLNSVSGISAADEIWISDGASSEFTKVQSVDSSAVTVTCKLANAHSNKTLYRVIELNYFQYQKTITPLSASGDIMILPGDTHLIVPHYSAALYYHDIEEPDRAAYHMKLWEDDLADAWLGMGKTETGAVGQFTL